MTPEQFAEIEILLRPLVTQLANIVARGVVNRTNDGGDLQTMQIGVLNGQPIDDAEHFQQYGFSSVPLTGAEAVVIFPGGDTAHPLIIAVDDRAQRPTGLNAGEVKIYSNSGASILMTEDGDIICEPKAGRKLIVKRAGGSAAAVATLQDLQDVRDDLHEHEHVCANTGLGSIPTTGGPSVTAPSGTDALDSE